MNDLIHLLLQILADPALATLGSIMAVLASISSFLGGLHHKFAPQQGRKLYKKKKKRRKRPNRHLRAARLQRRWSIEKAAEKADISPLTLGRWERGEQTPRSKALRRLCEAFALSAQDLGFG